MKQTFEDLYEHIIGVGKRYYDLSIQDSEEEKTKIKETIHSQLGSLSLEDQAELVSRLRENSIDVNGHKPRESSGYGIIRDVYCEHVLDDAMQSAKIKLANIQSGSFSPTSINEKIKNQLKELTSDQFDAFSRAVEGYQTPAHLEQSAKNRDEYAWKEVNGLMQEVALEDKYGMYEDNTL